MQRSKRLRLAAGTAALAVTAGLVAGAVQIRAASAEQQQHAKAEARLDLNREVSELRAALTGPASQAQIAAAALRLNLHETVTGSDRDADAIADDRARLVAQLRTAADALEEASTTPLPERPSVLSVAVVDPVFIRLERLENQAAETAERLRLAAKTAEDFGAAADTLQAAAEAYLATVDNLPDSSDPDTLATNWRNELVRLDRYQQAVDEAAEVGELALLVDAHRVLIDGMREVAQQAVSLLEDGDLDGYNALLAAHLDTDDPFGFRTTLKEATELSVRGTALERLRDARGYALGLLTKLELLRRDTPAAIADA